MCSAALAASEPIPVPTRYQFNDVLLYSRTSKETGIEKGEYARVKSVDAPNNLLTVVRADGSEQTYDPRRRQGVSIYKEQEKAFFGGRPHPVHRAGKRAEG